LRCCTGPPHTFDQVDVCDDQSVATWAETVFAAAGQIELLVNNAAVILDELGVADVVTRQRGSRHGERLPQDGDCLIDFTDENADEQ
jgi:NAD(P)-dependent dehydrogenase (short-subunit alcohol dehydrogenase family)